MYYVPSFQSGYLVDIIIFAAARPRSIPPASRLPASSLWPLTPRGLKVDKP